MRSSSAAAPPACYAGLKLAQAGFSVAFFEEHQAVGEPVHCTGVLAAKHSRLRSLSACAFSTSSPTVQVFRPSGDDQSSTPHRRWKRSSSIARVSTSGSRGRPRPPASRLFSGRGSPRSTSIGMACARPPTHVARGACCVLACGANYALQRKLGLGMPRLLLHSAQMELPAARLVTLKCISARSVAPQGFAWAVPVQRDQPYVRIGVMCERGAGRISTHRGADVGSAGESPSDVRQPRLKDPAARRRSSEPTAIACWRSATPPVW